MSEIYSYSWRDFQHKIDTRVESLEKSFDMQQWCMDNLGDRWATTPPTGDLQSWYFINASDATMFMLRWV